MSFFARTTSALAAASLLFVLAPESARAANSSLWIHGRNTSQNTTPGNYNDWTYWGASGTAGGVNKKSVNWDGVSTISATNGKIRDALDCFCTGASWCYIAAHSAGNLQIGYALALYGGSSRSVKNAAPNGSGVCGNTGGTQTGWNIKWVDVGGGAAGGSELANMGEWAVGDALTNDLKTANARALYNHNTTRSKTFYMFAGAKGTAYSGILSGQDDEAVPYHSAGGVSVTGGFCNSGDWFCDGTLTSGTGATSNGKAKWSLHHVMLVDTGEAYDHYTAGGWGGVMGQVRADMVKYAL